MNIRIARFATALAALLATPLSAQAQSNITTVPDPGLIQRALQGEPGTPLARSQRIAPDSLAPVPESLHLHRTDARLQWQADEAFGTRLVWWLDQRDSEFIFVVRVAPNVRYRLTCDFAPPEMPIVEVRDLGQRVNAIENERREPPVPSASAGGAFPGTPRLPEFIEGDIPQAADRAEPNPRFEYAPLRASWRRAVGRDRMLTTSIEAVPRNVWREVRIRNPERGGTVVLYGCDITPSSGG